MARSAVPVEKVTVSLPPDVLAYADEKARAEGTSRSRVIAQALSRAKAEDEAQLAAEGYRFYADESSAFAESSLSAVGDALSRAG